MESEFIAESPDWIGGGVEGRGGVVVVVVGHAVYRAWGEVLVALRHVRRGGKVQADEPVGGAAGAVGDGFAVVKKCWE